MRLLPWPGHTSEQVPPAAVVEVDLRPDAPVLLGVESRMTRRCTMMPTRPPVLSLWVPGSARSARAWATAHIARGAGVVPPLTRRP
jgi:hypothetical protein